jgi:hypothetical protein
MRKVRWNRSPLRGSPEAEAAAKPFDLDDADEFIIARVKIKRRRKKHPGFTLVQKQRLWIFEK